jgi:hypothetical protein
MRKSLLIGVTSVLSAAAIATPAMAQTPAPTATPAPTPTWTPQDQAEANAPQLHIDTISLAKSRHGYVIARVPLTAINMGNQQISAEMKSNLKPIQPANASDFAPESSTFGVPGDGKVYKVYTVRYAFNHSIEQLRKSLKITLSNATNGGYITNSTATVS